MSRRSLQSNYGLYFASPVSTLQTGSGGTNPKPSGAQAVWTGGPWYTDIDWSSASIASSSGRTFSQWTGSLGHTYCNSDHTADAPTNTWHTQNSDPMWTITGMFNGNVNVGGTARVNVPTGVYVAFAGGDQNLNVWNHDTGFHYDMYGVANINNTNHTMTAQSIWQLHESADGWGTGVYPNGRARGVRAAGCQFSGGDITAADWRAGVINHGLAIAAARANWQAGTARLPAVKTDGGESGYTGNVPLGTMLAIPPPSRGGPAKPTGMSQIGSMVWDAASKKGIYCVDSTGGFTWYADDGNDPVTNSWVDPLRTAGGDGDRILNALRQVTNGKPTLANHA